MKRNFAAWGGFSWPLVVGAVAFLIAIAAGQNLLNDGDTFWHLATGRWMLEQGAIPHADPFSHTYAGAPWTSHEWLSALLLYLAYQLASWTGVVVLTAAAFATALACLTRYSLRYVEPAHALIFAILAFGMAAPHLLARPHVLALPLLVIWAAGLIRASEEGRAPQLWLLAVLVVWANMHGSFTLGIALAAGFGVEALLRAEKGERLAAARQWGGFLLLSILAGMLTPHGVEGYLFTTQVMGMSYALGNIKEWLSPNFQKFQLLELWLLLLLLALFTRGLKLPPVRLSILLGLVHMALSHGRYVELVGLLSPLLLAPAIGAQWARWSKEDGQTATLDRFFRRHAQPASLPSIILGFFVIAALSGYKMHQRPIMPPEKAHPIAAIEAVKRLGIEGPVYNGYAFGGYLIFSGIPVFMDGRADMYGDAFLRRYLEAQRLPKSRGLDKLLDEYHVRWTLLPPNSVAVDYLDMLPGWRRAYADETAVVHLREGGVAAK